MQSPHQILWNVGGSQGYRRVSLESGEIKFSIPGDNIQGTVRTQALNSNVWYHVVATFEGGDPAGAQFGGMKLYVDGVGDTISVSDLDNPYPLTSYNAVQGIGSLNGVYPTNGHFDDVIIYNTALTDSEVESLYRDTLPPTFSASFTDGAKEGWEIDSYDSSSNPRFRNVRFENLNDEMVFEIPNMDMEDQEWENRVFQVDSQNGRVLVKIFDSASLEVPIAKFLTIPLSPGNDLVRVWNSINSINDMDSVSPDSVYSTEEISNGDITLVAGANTLISKVESVNSQEYAYVPVMNSGGEGGNSTCGNGVVEGNETCDDGNVANGDGCDEYCQTESGSGSGQGAVPEFSDYAIALLLLTVVGGFVAMRRRQ